jgi:hypothetical protein
MGRVWCFRCAFRPEAGQAGLFAYLNQFFIDIVQIKEGVKNIAFSVVARIQRSWSMVMRTFVSAVVLALVTSGALAQSVVEPGKLFAGSLVNVHSPNSEGWKIISSTSHQLAFAKSGAASNESYAAQFTLFPLGETKNAEEFVALIKSGVEADTPADRFNSLESRYEYTEERAYPCVRVNIITEDKQARTSFFSRESLKLQLSSLYCRHPTRTGVAFVAGFSHRGATLDPALETQAQAFIAGVQVAGK